VSKAARMREMQHEINWLHEENRKLKTQLFAYRKRDRPLASDCIPERRS